MPNDNANPLRRIAEETWKKMPCVPIPTEGTITNPIISDRACLDAIESALREVVEEAMTICKANAQMVRDAKISDYGGTSQTIIGEAVASDMCAAAIRAHFLTPEKPQEKETQQ